MIKEKEDFQDFENEEWEEFKKNPNELGNNNYFIFEI